MSEVYVYIYDLSNGLAKTMSKSLLGKHISGIWHTGIVVFGKEYFFGGDGINFCRPCGTVLGVPQEKKLLGKTEISIELFNNYLADLGQCQYKPETYNLLEHNCNNFSSDVAQFLTGHDIPKDITSLPQEVLSSPMGAMLRPFLDKMRDGIRGVDDVGQAIGGASKGATGTRKPDGGASGSANKKGGQGGSNNNATDLIPPVSCQEPLSADVDAILNKEGGLSNEHLATLLSVVEFVSDTDQPSWGLGPAHMDLLDVVCETKKPIIKVAIIETFRLAVWRSPDSLVALLSERKHRIGRLVNHVTRELETTLEWTSTLNAALTFLTNCVGESRSWSFDESMRLPLVSIVNFCVKGLEECDTRSDALGLAKNLAMHRELAEEDALQLGSYLLHLCSLKDTVLRPVESDHITSAVYLLMKRFPILVDIAQTQDLPFLDTCQSELCERIKEMLKS